MADLPNCRFKQLQSAAPVLCVAAALYGWAHVHRGRDTSGEQPCCICIAGKGCSRQLGRCTPRTQRDGSAHRADGRDSHRWPVQSCNHACGAPSAACTLLNTCPWACCQMCVLPPALHLKLSMLADPTSHCRRWGECWRAQTVRSWSTSCMRGLMPSWTCAAPWRRLVTPSLQGAGHDVQMLMSQRQEETPAHGSAREQSNAC